MEEANTKKRAIYGAVYLSFILVLVTLWEQFTAPTGNPYLLAGHETLLFQFLAERAFNNLIHLGVFIMFAIIGMALFGPRKSDGSMHIVTITLMVGMAVLFAIMAYTTIPHWPG
jgi:hypothetical protein